MRLIARLLRPTLFAYWIALIVALHWPISKEQAPRVFAYDKLIHGAIYGGLAVLVAWNFERSPSRLGRASRWLAFLVGILAVALQGAIDEVTQPLSGRSADIADWGADLAGAAICLAIWAILIRRHTN